MAIHTEYRGHKLIVKIKGRIDSTNAPQFAEALSVLDGIDELIMNFEETDYISSAGIRVILSAYKTMCGQGSMRLIHVNDTVYSALTITGLAEKLDIERSGEEK